MYTGTTWVLLLFWQLWIACIDSLWRIRKNLPVASLNYVNGLLKKSPLSLHLPTYKYCKICCWPETDDKSRQRLSSDFYTILWSFSHVSPVLCWALIQACSHFFSRVFTDPIHLDRARMTKTPPMVDDELDNLNAEELEGGEEQLFYIDSWQPSP